MTPLESKTELTLLTDDASDSIEWSLQRASGSFESRRAQLIELGSALVGYYSEGSAALAVDFYDDQRASAPGTFRAEPVILDRVLKIRRSLAWASEPLSTDDSDAALGRLTEVVKSETVRPYRDTVLTNLNRDPERAGWTRIASVKACGFCRMLAAKGAVYRKETANFAAHDSCGCTAAPVFKGGEQGPEASALQYIGAKRRRTPAEKQRLREAIADFEGN